MNARLLSISALLATMALCAVTSPARADLQITLNAAASKAAGPGAYVYDVSFSNSISSDGKTPSQKLSAGDFTTLYDIDGFKSATLNANIQTLFSLSTAPTGPTAVLTAPTDTGLENVTLTYIDGGLTTATTFTAAFTVFSTDTGVKTGQYSSQVTNFTDGNSPISSVGSVSVPALAVPEPSGVVAALAGLPSVAMLVGFVRRRRSAAA